MEQNSIFLLRSELINSEKGQKEKSFFEHILRVRFLRETGHDITIYDPELKMHFEDRNAWASIYEIETVDVSVKCSRRLQKAEDFIRRINHKYDWIQVRVNAKGKILSIENKDELKKRWVRLKESILKDYKGATVERALNKIDNRFGTEDQIVSAVSQYFYFGLLFPGIPQKHGDTWNNKRFIEFSEYEEEKFEEQISYDHSENDLRTYNISGQIFPESNTIIDKYEGNLSLIKGDIFPDNAKINIIFRRDDITNQWNFTMYRYN